VIESIWLGNRTCIAPHFDNTENLACVVGGRRRFTMFPPEQIRNLYVGPLDLTPAGQPISLVDVRNPDLSRFPRFAEALAAAEVAELAPGDCRLHPRFVVAQRRGAGGLQRPHQLLVAGRSRLFRVAVDEPPALPS